MRKRRGKKSEHPSKPITGGIWYWNCNVCHKKFIKDDSHNICYNRYCQVCEVSFVDVKALKEHAERYHMDIKCNYCDIPYDNLSEHIRNYH